MAIWLKVSTAVDVMLGPFLADTDGKTAQTALSLTQPDIRLSKNGGAFAQKSAAQTLTHAENGWYPANLSTTDTGAVGTLIVNVSKTGCLPVWREFLVVPAIVYDSIVGSGTAVADLLDVSVTQWLGTAAATPTVAGVPEVDITHFNGTAGTFAAGRPEVNMTHIAGSVVSATSAQLGVNLVNIAGSAVNASSAQLGVNLVNIAGAAVATGTAQLGVNVVNWAGSAVATPLTAGVPIVDDRVLRTNTATAGASTSITLDASAPTTVDLFKGCIIEIIGGTGVGQSRNITAYSAGRVATVTPAWVTNPASGSVFAIKGGQVDIEAIGGAAITASGGRMEVNTVQFNGSTVVQSGGRPEVNTTHFGGSALTQSSGRPEVNTSHWAGGAVNALVSGRVDASVGAMATDTITSGAVAASAVTEIQSGLATSSQLTTVQNKTDLIPGTLDGKTFAEIIQLVAAVLMGKVSGMGSNAPVFRSINDGADRVSATTDASGNRTAVTLNNT